MPMSRVISIVRPNIRQNSSAENLQWWPPIRNHSSPRTLDVITSGSGMLWIKFPWNTIPESINIMWPKHDLCNSCCCRSVNCSLTKLMTPNCEAHLTVAYVNTVGKILVVAQTCYCRSIEGLCIYCLQIWSITKESNQTRLLHYNANMEETQHSSKFSVIFAKAGGNKIGTWPTTFYLILPTNYVLYMQSMAIYWTIW